MRESSEHVTGREEDGDGHQRHLGQFRPTHAEARDNEPETDDTEHDPCAQHERDVTEACPDDDRHD